MRDHALDLFEVGRPREELLGDVEPELAADQDVREAQPVEGDVDRAFRAVLDRHDPVVHPAPLHVVEDLADGARGAARSTGAEALEGGLVGEGRLGPQVGDGEGGLEGPARGQDFAPDGDERLGGQRPGVQRPEPADDLGFTLRGIGRRVLTSFEVSDLEDGLGALGEELKDFVVEVVDPGTPIVQVHRDSHEPHSRRIRGIIGPRVIQEQVKGVLARPPRRAATAPRAA